MVAGFVIGLLIVITLVIAFTYLFFWDLVALLINFVLLYVVLARVYYKLMQKDVMHYVIGAVAALLIVLLAGPLLPFWKITSFAIITAIIAEVIYLIPGTPWRKK